jgi:hypothetical protein
VINAGFEGVGWRQKVGRRISHNIVFSINFLPELRDLFAYRLVLGAVTDLMGMAAVSEDTATGTVEKTVTCLSTVCRAASMLKSSARAFEGGTSTNIGTSTGSKRRHGGSASWRSLLRRV